ncbi:MAG: GNAT family N-acetyltransferase [Planctomycetota bacterium]|jgi:RimJ/RimL family protein N-acetyltransferase
MNAPAELATERLRLRRPSLDDLADLVRMHDDIRVMKTLGGRQDARQTGGGLAKSMEHWDRYGFGGYTLRDPDGRYLGRCGPRRVEIDGAWEVEVGWAVIFDEQNKGYATEAARRCVALCFDELGLDDLVSFTLPFNAASRRVMEKLGFAYEKDCWYYELPHVLYRLTQ